MDSAATLGFSAVPIGGDGLCAGSINQVTRAGIVRGIVGVQSLKEYSYASFDFDSIEVAPLAGREIIWYMDLHAAARMDFLTKNSDAVKFSRYDVAGLPRFDVAGLPRYDVAGLPRYDVAGLPRYDVLCSSQNLKSLI